MTKLLVTGASGFLGWNLCQVAQPDWEVYGTYHTHPLKLPGAIPLDLTDFQAVKQLLQTLQPAAVIHTAAQSNPNFCQTEPELSFQINVASACNLAGLCADANIPCVFTSSELVFDGTRSPYREMDPVNPSNLYGEQKVQAELGMRERHPGTIVCRMPLMFGEPGPVASSFIQPFIHRLRSGQELTLFVDEFRTPVSGTAAAQGLLLALKQAPPYLHLGGRERISRYQFGQLLVEVLQLPAETIRACRQADVVMAAPRPADVSLDSALAFSLGYNPPLIREALQSLQGKI